MMTMLGLSAHESGSAKLLFVCVFVVERRRFRRIDDYKSREDLLKQRIQQRMGDCSKALFETGSVSWKRSKDSVGLDVPTLLLNNPELLNEYPLTRAGSRRFLINTTP